MVNSPIIHIGLPKAASTFIRRAYFSHMSDNVLVPRAELFERLKLSSFDPQSYRQLINQHENGGDELIFSGENLSGTFWDDKDAAQIAHNLYKSFPQARILIVLREQLDYLASAYSFCLTKGYRMAGFEKFVRSRQAELISKCNYAKLVQLYYDLFTPAQVKVLTFEQFRTEREEFDRELTEFCNMPLKYDGLPSRRNASVRSRRQLENIRRVNNLSFGLIKLEKLFKRLIFGRHTHLMKQAQHFTIQDWIVAAVCKIVPAGDQHLQFPADFLAAAEPAIRESNAKCADLTGIDLKSLGYLL